MTAEYQNTPEESTFDQTLGEEMESLSEAARTVVGQALNIADKSYLLDNISYMPQWEDDDMEVVRRAAAELAEHDCEGLTKIWRSALAAAASIEPYDFDTHLGYRIYPANFHRYYRKFSRIVEDAEWAKREAEWRKEMLKEREPVDPEDIPF
jgi:hypothetical protein